MIKAVFYARVSTEEEKQVNALQKQVEECRDCIKAQGWDLVDEYIDEGKSGTKIKGRDEYKRLLEDLESSRFEIIVIKSQDRLMRNVKDWYIFLDRLITNGKRLFMYIDNQFYTSENALITGIKAILAEEYSRELSKKLKNAHKRRLEKAKAGEKVPIMAAGITIGYKIENGEVVVDEAEAEIVRYCFKRYLEKAGYRQIAIELNDLGYKNQAGNYFESGTVQKILRNERYKGVYVLNRHVQDFDKKKVVTNPEEEWVYLEGVIPAIVSKEDWERAQAIRESRSSGGRGKKTGKSVLSGKCFCGKCGAVYWKENHKKGTRFRCSNYLRYGINGAKGCNNRSFYERDLLSIISELCELFVEPQKDVIRKSLLSWLKGLYEALESSQGDDKTVKEIARQEKRKEKLLEAFMDDLISKKDYSKKLKEVEGTIERLKGSLIPQADKKDLEDIQRVIDNIDEEIDVFLGSEMIGKSKQEYLLEHITKITVLEDMFCFELDLVGGVMIAGEGFNQFVNKDRYICVQTEKHCIGLRIAA